ncbi:MAG: phosphoribosylglycinamide formyltransferase [Euryarchaeota archaeon]|nr:phosphoribosylglycinamide formyltransferase [Euryarchaeota archaeon]
MLKVAFLASGAGTNLQAVIDSCDRGETKARIGLVLSDHRDSGALVRAKKHGIEAHFVDPKGLARPDHEAKMLALIRESHCDLVALAGYMRILTPAFVRPLKGRLINIHPSLLPAFRGLDAQAKAHEYGVKITGCTTHFVEEDVDTGPIILQAAVPVLDGDTVETLRKRILEQEHVIYPLTIHLIAEGRVTVSGRKVTIKGFPADPSGRLVSSGGG